MWKAREFICHDTRVVACVSVTITRQLMRSADLIEILLS